MSRWGLGFWVVLVGLTSACRPTNYALLSRSAAPSLAHPAPAEAVKSNPIAAADTVPQPMATLVANAQTGPLPASTRPQPRARHLENPDATPVRKTRWIDQQALYMAPSTGYAYEEPTTPAPKRRVPKLVKGALVGSVASGALLTVASPSGWLWVLGALLPLASTLAGVAGLTKVQRNREQYRGKGWAMSAILIGSGVMGMVLVAAAALATSNVVWK